MTTYIIIAMLIGLMQIIVKIGSGNVQKNIYYPNLASYLFLYDNRTDK